MKKENEINKKFIDQILRRTKNTLKFLLDDDFHMFWNVKRENTTLFLQRNKLFQYIDDCIVRKLNEICFFPGYTNLCIYDSYLLRSRQGSNQPQLRLCSQGASARIT